MLERTYDTEVCSAARALEVVGERWSLLIVRNLMFASMSRFSELQRSLGVAPNVLAKRLADFVDAGIVEQRGEHGRHAEYVLTERGRELRPVILALTAWGDRWAPGQDGPPISYHHDGCGGDVSVVETCTRCGQVQAAGADTPDGRGGEVTAAVADWVGPERERLRVRRRTQRARSLGA